MDDALIGSHPCSYSEESVTQLVIINNEMNIDEMQQIYTAKGDGFDLTPAGILLLAGDTAYCSPTQTTAIGRLNAADVIGRIDFADC
ncbi:hypothetical protein SAMN04515618_107159 [Collimonas sp. OK307]|uniref:hypothetical protein n=1 Tax=Collimonas sp. OK307 TaxID=1801620 RepID=UPI0008EDB85D|nr:hypothetical protein [Collimonas sp. OK307]SFI00138.1 hypothetical protein SAMN04515618_107159 [Collimonas sp. OK307]